MKKLYPIYDRMTIAESKALGFDKPPVVLTSVGMPPRDVHAVRTGEFREPQKGEWYLSGAIPGAWKAPNTLSTKFHICKLVRTRTRTVTEIVE